MVPAGVVETIVAAGAVVVGGFEVTVALVDAGGAAVWVAVLVTAGKLDEVEVELQPEMIKAPSKRITRGIKYLFIVSPPYLLYYVNL